MEIYIVLSTNAFAHTSGERSIVKDYLLNEEPNKKMWKKEKKTTKTIINKTCENRAVK